VFHWPSPDDGEETVSFRWLTASLNRIEEPKGAENREIVAGVIRTGLLKVDLAETPGGRALSVFTTPFTLEVVKVVLIGFRPRNAVVRAPGRPNFQRTGPNRGERCFDPDNLEVKADPLAWFVPEQKTESVPRLAVF
jgi:hypothetical protein